MSTSSISSGASAAAQSPEKTNGSLLRTVYFPHEARLANGSAEHPQPYTLYFIPEKGTRITQAFVPQKGAQTRKAVDKVDCTAQQHFKVDLSNVRGMNAIPDLRFTPSTATGMIHVSVQCARTGKDGYTTEILKLNAKTSKMAQYRLQIIEKQLGECPEAKLLGSRRSMRLLRRERKPYGR